MVPVMEDMKRIVFRVQQILMHVSCRQMLVKLCYLVNQFFSPSQNVIVVFATASWLPFFLMQAAELVPSQILWINIPSLSKLHWHPVNIAHVDLDDPKDQSSDGLVTVHFKAYGAWTKVLLFFLSLVWVDDRGVLCLIMLLFFSSV